MLLKAPVVYEINTLELVKFPKTKFGIKNTVFECVLGLNFKKNYCYIFEINTLDIAKNEFLANRVKFSKRFTFSKGPGSAFTERVGPGPNPIF